MFMFNRGCIGFYSVMCYVFPRLAGFKGLQLLLRPHQRLGCWHLCFTPIIFLGGGSRPW